MEEEGEEIEKGEEWKRNSRNRRINKKSRMLVNFIGERGWKIFNEKIRGDEQEEYTFTGKGNTIIDYVLGNREIKEKVVKMRMGDNMDSDHQPVELTLRGEGEKWKTEGRRKRIWRGVWDEEGGEAFRKELGEMKLREKDLDTEKRELEERIRKTIKEVEKERKLGKDRKRGWWDRRKERVHGEKEERREREIREEGEGDKKGEGGMGHSK